MEKQKKSLFEVSGVHRAMAFVMAASLLLSGCNTFEGAGEDLEEVGEEIKEEAR